MKGNWTAPHKAIPVLAPPRVGNLTRRGSELSDDAVADHLSRLPRRSDDAAVEKFATDAAALLSRSLVDHSTEGGDGTHVILHRAFTSILEADDETNTLWKRVIGKRVLPADEAMDRLSKALISGLHQEDKRTMETYAISSMYEAVGDRVKSGKAGMTEFNM